MILNHHEWAAWDLNWSSPKLQTKVWDTVRTSEFRTEILDYGPNQFISDTMNFGPKFPTTVPIRIGTVFWSALLIHGLDENFSLNFFSGHVIGYDKFWKNFKNLAGITIVSFYLFVG